MKAICLIRTSTDRQRIEEQRAEVVQMAYADGYTDNDIEVIGKCGASAIKLDDAYMENLNALYKRIENGDVEVVYAWAIDRIGRDEVILMQLKNTLVKNKVQLIIKDPSLRLLNADGTVNNGVELAFSLFATMAKQEMERKKERFRRGKKENAESGKFNGGIIPYGYDVDDNGYYIADDEEANNVILAFQLMASNKYSVATLTKELRDRGVMVNNRLITYQFASSMLKNTCYIGYRNKYAFVKKYPRLISDDLFNKVQSVMTNNNSTKAKASKHYTFASLLIKCPTCGRNYISSHGKKYVCSAHNAPSIRRAMGQKECDNNLTIDLSHMDGLLWSIATSLHYQYIQGLDAEQKISIEKQITVLLQKKNESSKLFAEIEERYERLEEVYISGRSKMTKTKYDTLLSAIEKDEKALTDEVIGYDEEISRLQNLLSSVDDKDEMRKWFDDNYVLTNLKAEENEKMMYDVVHKYITSISLESVVTSDDLQSSGDFCKDGKKVNSRYYNVNNREAIKVNITCYDGSVIECYFIKNFRNCDTKFIYVDNNVAYPYSYEPIIREGDGYATTRSIILMKNLIKEIGTCLRSEWSNKDEIFGKLIFDIFPKYHEDDDETEYAIVKQSYRKLQSYNCKWVANALVAASKYYEIDGVSYKDIMAITQDH